MSRCASRDAHCWHRTGGTEFAGNGRDQYRCCFCGFEYQRFWELVANPEHGPFGPKARQYANPEPQP